MKVFLTSLYILLCSFQLNSNIEKGLELTYKNRDKESEEYWNNLLEKDNKNIDFQFFKLFNRYIEIIDTESYYSSNDFINECNLLLSKLDSTSGFLEERNFYFLKASLLVFEGGIKAKNKHYLSAYKMLKKSDAIAESILNSSPEFYDPYLITGVFEYWKNKFIDSLPLISKNYKKNIEIISKSLKGNKFIKFLALHQLAWIYYLNSEYSISIKYCKQGIKEFNNSRIFLKPLAENYKKLNNITESLKLYNEIITSYRNQGYEQKYINVKYNYVLAELYKDIRKMSKMKEIVLYILNLDLNETENEVSEEYIENAKKMIN